MDHQGVWTEELDTPYGSPRISLQSGFSFRRELQYI